MQQTCSRSLLLVVAFLLLSNCVPQAADGKPLIPTVLSCAPPCLPQLGADDAFFAEEGHSELLESHIRTPPPSSLTHDT